MAGESARDKANRAREKAERLARYAEHWEKGAQGESATADALARLGPDWICWHDLRWPGRRLANIDHIAIGPGGIFVIVSKNWSGSVGVKEGVLRQNGYQREAAVASCAESALAVGELIPSYFNAIRPVLCFVREEPLEGWARDVMLCSTNNVVDMLLTRARLLDDAAVADAARSLSERLRPKSMPAPSRPVRHARSATAAPSVSPAFHAAGSRRTRVQRFFVGLGLWSATMLLLGLVLTAADPATANSIGGPAALVAVFASWMLARRIVR